MQDGIGHPNGVGAFLLGNRDGHRRLARLPLRDRCCGNLALTEDGPGEELVLRESASRPPAVPHIAGDFLGPVLDPCDVLEEDRPAIEHADDQILQLPGVLKGLSGVHLDHLIHTADIPRGRPHVGCLMARFISSGET